MNTPAVGNGIKIRKTDPSLSANVPKAVFLSRAEREKLAMESAKLPEVIPLEKKVEKRMPDVEMLEDGERSASPPRIKSSLHDRHDRDMHREPESRSESRRDKDIDRERDRDRDRDRHRDRDRDRDRYDRGGDRSHQSRSSDGRRDEYSSSRHDDQRKVENTMSGTTNVNNTNSNHNEDQEAAARLKKRYLGGLLNSSEESTARRRDKLKLRFEWDATEDTSETVDTLYTSRHDDIKRPTRPSISEPIPKSSHLNDIAAEKHWSEKQLCDMTERDWRIFKEDFDITAKGGDVPPPIRSWEESTLPSALLSVIHHLHYDKPTPVQRQAIPIGLHHRDLMGIAETGSGKTAAFLLPMLVHIQRFPPLNEETAMGGPFALVLAPTRELALQIEKEATRFASHVGLKCVALVGGHAMEEQAFNLRDGAHIIIATPGRLKDCLDKSILVLSQCYYVVMDEADVMLNMGFEEDVNAILEKLPKTNRTLSHKVVVHRQMSMFSATMPPAVERMARKYLDKPVTVTIGTQGQAVDRIQQIVEIHTESSKRSRLLAILERGIDPPIIIFVNTKKAVDSLSKTLEREGYPVTALHGGKTQEQREESLKLLTDGKKEILVATDVAGRGIDVKDVSLVVNYDMAASIEPYTHRIGRTGRAGKTGKAITFLTMEDTDVFYDLKKMLASNPQNVCPIELSRHEAAKEKGFAKAFKKQQQMDD